MLRDIFEINALIEDITDPSATTFDPEKARRLVALIPAQKQPLFSLSHRYNRKASDTTGYVPGIGTMTFGGGKSPVTIQYGPPVVQRIGGYKITHSPGSMNIALLWADTQQDQTGQSCVLRYRVRNGKPIVLKAAQSMGFRVGDEDIAFTYYKAWKYPAANAA